MKVANIYVEGGAIIVPNTIRKEGKAFFLSRFIVAHGAFVASYKSGSSLFFIYYDREGKIIADFIIIREGQE